MRTETIQERTKYTVGVLLTEQERARIDRYVARNGLKKHYVFYQAILEYLDRQEQGE